MTEKAHVSEDGKPQKPSYAGPRSPLRAMQIIEALAEKPDGITLAPLARQLNIPKTSVLNHLRSLINADYVSNGKTGYVLGAAALRMGIMVVANSDALAVIEPILQKLAHESGETTILGQLDAQTKEVVYIKVVAGRYPIRYSPPVGTRRELYLSGLGRALLAFQPEEFIEEYLNAQTFERQTPNTISSRAKLLSVLKQIRRDERSITVGESIADLGAIASPIFDQSNKVEYVIGVAMPVDRLEEDRERTTELVHNAARRASWAFGNTQSAREQGGAHA